RSDRRKEADIASDCSVFSFSAHYHCHLRWNFFVIRLSDLRAKDTQRLPEGCADRFGSLLPVASRIRTVEHYFFKQRSHSQNRVCQRRCEGLSEFEIRRSARSAVSRADDGQPR